MRDDLTQDQQISLYAAQHFANGRGASTVEIDDLPDVAERTIEAIEMLAHDAVGPISVEHTHIEAYTDRSMTTGAWQSYFTDLVTYSGTRSDTPVGTLCASTSGAPTGCRGDPIGATAIKSRDGFANRSYPSRPSLSEIRITLRANHRTSPLARLSFVCNAHPKMTGDLSSLI
jgi:hypothetical protein